MVINLLQEYYEQKLPGINASPDPLAQAPFPYITSFLSIDNVKKQNFRYKLQPLPEKFLFIGMLQTGKHMQTGKRMQTGKCTQTGKRICIKFV